MSPTFIELPTNTSGTSKVLVALNHIREIYSMGVNSSSIICHADSTGGSFIQVHVPYSELKEIISQHCKVIRI